MFGLGGWLKKKRSEKTQDLLALIRLCLETGRYRETNHAVYRKQQRKIILPEILDVLHNGRHEKRKDKFDEQYKEWNYAVRGKTIIGDDIRIIVSFDRERDLLIITAFYIKDGK